MSDLVNKEHAVKVFEEALGGFTFEIGAAMCFSIRGKQYEILNQL